RIPRPCHYDLVTIITRQPNDIHGFGLYQRCGLYSVEVVNDGSPSIESRTPRTVSANQAKGFCAFWQRPIEEFVNADVIRAARQPKRRRLHQKRRLLIERDLILRTLDTPERIEVGRGVGFGNPDAFVA